jgi:hypothetical protein
MGRLRRIVTGAAFVLAGLLGVGSGAAQGPPAGWRESGPVVERGTVRVFHAAGQRALAEEVAAVASAPLVVPGMGRVTAPPSTRIYLAPDPAGFRALTDGRAPEWAGGVAFPAVRVIVLPAYPTARSAEEGPEVTIRHEVAHLAIHARLPGAVPRWFDEGLSEMAAGSWDAEAAWKLRVAIALGRAPALDSLALGWPAGADRARLAYLLSTTAVQHLHRRGGEEGFRLLLANWRAEGTLDAAVRTTFGLTMGQLEDEWRDSVAARYGWLQALTAASLVWLVVTVLFLVSWIPRRRRNLAKLAEMRAEERMLMPPRMDGVDVEYPIG